jgi:hypothetical protein
MGETTNRDKTFLGHPLKTDTTNNGHCPNGQPHNWLLTSDEGVVRGICKKCGAVKEYPTLVRNPIFLNWQPTKDKVRQ